MSKEFSSTPSSFRIHSYNPYTYFDSSFLPKRMLSWPVELEEQWLDDNDNLVCSRRKKGKRMGEGRREAFGLRSTSRKSCRLV